MKKAIILFFLLFQTICLFSEPEKGKPIMVVDCQKKQGVFNNLCFKMLQFATNRLSESGEFSNVRSLSNNSFLFRNSSQVYTMTLSDNSGFKNYSLRSSLLNQYQSEMSVLCDKNFRYAVVYGTVETDVSDCSICNEIVDTLAYSKIKSWFYYDVSFSNIIETNFERPALRIQLNFSNHISVTNVGSFYRLYSLQNKLYSIGGVKTVYSPVNIYYFISSVILNNPAKMTPEQKWNAVIESWELGGERRSSYIDFKGNSMYIDVFSYGIPESMIENIRKFLTTYATDVVDGWFLYDGRGNIIAKKDDALKKDLRVTVNESNTAGK